MYPPILRESNYYSFKFKWTILNTSEFIFFIQKRSLLLLDLTGFGVFWTPLFTASLTSLTKVQQTQTFQCTSGAQWTKFTNTGPWNLQTLESSSGGRSSLLSIWSGFKNNFSITNYETWHISGCLCEIALKNHKSVQDFLDTVQHNLHFSDPFAENLIFNMKPQYIA